MSPHNMILQHTLADCCRCCYSSSIDACRCLTPTAERAALEKNVLLRWLARLLLLLWFDPFRNYDVAREQASKEKLLSEYFRFKARIRPSLECLPSALSKRGRSKFRGSRSNQDSASAKNILTNRTQRASEYVK